MVSPHGRTSGPVSEEVHVRYRRLGATELMVSEIALDARALRSSEGQDEATAEATVRAAIALGVTVFTWTVSDASEDIEPLLAAGAGVDRGRLTLVARLDIVPSAADLGPQVEAIASRLGTPVDIVAFPGDLDAPAQAAFEEARERGLVRFAAVDAGDSIEVPAARLLAADAAGVQGVLAQPGVASALVGVADPGELRALLGELGAV